MAIILTIQRNMYFPNISTIKCVFHNDIGNRS